MNTNKMEPLLQNAMNGDQDALNVLLRSCMNQLRGTAAKFFRNQEDVEDIVQESLLSAYRNFGQYQGRAKFSTWLHRIVINKALMELRRRKVRTMISLDKAPLNDEGCSFTIPPPDPAPNPEANYLRMEEDRLLKETLERIRPTFQSALHTYYFQELDTKEGATALGITMSNFKSRLYHARRALSKFLRQADLWRNTRTEHPSLSREAEPASTD